MDLEKLEQLAREATPGPWKCDEYSDITAGDYYIVRNERDDSKTPSPEDSRYIAALSPDVALALIRIARAAEALERNRESKSRTWIDGVCDALAALERT